MKKTLLLVIIVAILAGLITHYYNSPEVIVTNLLKKARLESGNLVYKVYFFGFIPVGEARIKKETAETYNGQDVYRLSATASSARYLSKIFSATAELDSYIDRQTFNPLFFRQKTKLPNKGESIKEIRYDQKNNIMTIGTTRRQIMPDTQDPLSAVYNLRRIDFNKAREFKINLNTNQKNYLMAGEVKIRGVIAGREILKLIIAEAEIKRSDGNPHHKSRISIALLEERQNAPVFIKIFASGAIINAKLVDIE